MAASSSSFSAFASLSKRLLCRGPPLCRQILLPSASRFSSTPLSSPDESDSTSEGGTPRSEETTPPSPSSGAADATAASEAPSRVPPSNAPSKAASTKAILVGKVGQQPVQKYLRSGRAVVLFSLGTGGIRNSRQPLENEEPREYAERCAVQWHRVCVYPDRLSGLALKHVKPGVILYLEGNLETKVFSDPISGLVRRIREVAIRGDGRLVFLGDGSKAAETEQEGLRRVGYY